MAFSRVFILACILAMSVQAEVRYAPPAPVVIPQQLRAGDQYFDMSVGGIESYMQTVKDSDPTAHSKLAPDLERLQTMRRVGTWTAVAALGVGGLLTVGGVTFLTSSSTSSGYTVSSPNWVALVGGLTLLSVSPFLYQIFGPGRTEYMGFINHHNQVRPQSPLKMELGFFPTPNGGQALFAARF